MNTYSRYLIASTHGTDLPENCETQEFPPQPFPIQARFKEDWPEYFEYTRHITEPRGSLKRALEEFWEGPAGTVADLGAGAGRDTIYLLDKGWKVYAMDKEEMAVQIIWERAKPEHFIKLSTEVAQFHLMKECPLVDIMNASFSLPFGNRSYFADSWKHIVEHIKINGLFVGQFFGLYDAWRWDVTMTFLSSNEVFNLFLQRFEILYIYQEERHTETSDGFPVYRHCYHVIARKIR